jgi:hypothetical protein
MDNDEKEPKQESFTTPAQMSKRHLKGLGGAFFLAI